ncbi:MAG: TlpA family protein disulfide reductase [Nitrospirota bacterium]|nr:TlpA family protein disulfide reductase [Nitrospirota bacterium]
MINYRNFSAAIIFIIIFVFCPASYDHARGSGSADDLVGGKAPSFELKDLSGNVVYLSSFRGRAVLLNFWATWCPYCRKERPHLGSLHTEYKDRGLVIISVATDRSENDIRNFMKDTPADFIVLADTNREAASLYNVRGYPTTFLIDREGMVRQKFVGFREWTTSDMKKVFDSVIDRN